MNGRLQSYMLMSTLCFVKTDSDLAGGQAETAEVSRFTCEKTLLWTLSLYSDTQMEL